MRTLAVVLLVGVATGRIAASSLAQTNTPAAADETRWSGHILQAYQQLQEQQQATLRALEQSRQDAAAVARAIEVARQEAEAAARRTAEAMEARMKQLEQAISAQREREIEAMQKAHRSTLIVVGVFAGTGFLGMLVFALLLLRSLNRRAEAALGHLVGPPFGHPFAAGALGAGDTQLVQADPTQQSTARFLRTIERLEKRIGELETSTHPAVLESAAQPKAATSERGVESANAQSADATSQSPARAEAEKAGRVALLLGKGQALLNLQQPDNALSCFDEVIAIDPTHAEAFVKKGAALEKLGRLDEAIDCYDRAIALDTAMTMAYLCKGGVFNRLERYGEALQCYEQALRAQQHSSVV